jgi:hypothetical protein
MNRLIALARIGLLGLAAASTPLFTGCSMDIEVGSTTGTGGAGSASATSTGATTSSSTGGGASCGCAADEYCSYPSKTCGADGELPTCEKRPQACDLSFSATCGCDGKIYSGECAAQSGGQDISNLGGCPPQKGSFACGAHFCDQASQYCSRLLSDVADEPDSFFCKELPAGCGATPACACLTGEPCADRCEATSDNGLLLTCPGG